MDLRQYARVLRAHWALIVLAVVVCTGAAAAVAWTRTQTYTAHTQMFVAAPAGPSNLSPSETYQGGLFSQQRVASYVDVVSSPPVAKAVIAQLRLSQNVQQVQSEIQASVPENTVLINVSVTTGSAPLSAAIANAVARQFPRFVNRLESSQPTRASPVKVSVTSPARVPTSPESTHKLLYLTLGVLLGLVLGIGGTVARELLDRRIRNDDDAEAITGAPILGRILRDPKADRRPLIVVGDPDSSGAEAYRRLRTNLRVLSMDHDLRSFVFSSAGPGEGKTLIVANLGFAFAQAGVAITLVDADMRRPRLGEVIGLEPTAGLSEVLTGEVALETALHRHPTLELEVLAGGAVPPNPTELLGSERCLALVQTLTRRATVVLFDAPALLPVSDAAVLSRLVSAVVLVARVPSTRAGHFDDATHSLRSVGKEALGVVLNGLPSREGWPYYTNGRRVAARVRADQPVAWGG
jgi:succinoglycan biosynthesis transport protein ExoP